MSRSSGCIASIPVADRRPGVHIMTGPIFVEGARPGDMLEVRYLQMTPRMDYGSNLAASWGYLYQEFDAKERVTIYGIDRRSNQAAALYGYDFQGKNRTPGMITHCPECDRQPALEGVRVPMRPHLGTAGVAPDVPGRVSTIPPGKHGGNIDNWRIGAGSTMYYPVAVDGGLFSVGDPHISSRRRRAVGHRDRSIAERAVSDRAAQGLQLSVAAARGSGLLDRARLR